MPDDRRFPVPSGDAELVTSDEPPVVARLVVEVRSDGSRTIARGALEDLEAGQRTALKVEGGSPLELAWSLARAMFALPQLARGAARAFLAARRDRERDREK